jgi:hypothetical protein
MTPEINAILAYTDPQTGRLTTEGLRFFAALLAQVKDLEARIEALEP